MREGLAFCLSLPLDYPGGNVLNPRRHPPVLRPTLRNGRPNMNYQLALDNPTVTDVINDDAVIMHLQYSTQWDSLAHVGQLFDANDDGVAEPVYYNGFRPGEHIVGPNDPEGRRRHRPGARPLDVAGQGARRGEHGGEVRAGPRRDDRPARPRRPGARRRSGTTS